METYIKLTQYEKKLQAMRKILDSMLSIPEAKESKKVSKIVSRTLKKRSPANTAISYSGVILPDEEKTGDAA